ncbi:MAG: prolyl oligopeptidase family serine peptidase [Pirellulaceae bacterium]
MVTLRLGPLDETNVNNFTVTDHIPVHQELEVSSYPKAGDPNPEVGLGVWDRESGEVRWVDLSVTTTEEPLVSRVGWAGDQDQLVYQIQDRVQTFLDFRRFDPASGTNSLLIREESPAWIETPGDPTWLADGRFLWLSPRTGSQHLYLCEADGTVARPLTSGSGEVRSVVKVDERRGEVWVLGTFDSRIESHAYRVSLDGGEVVRVTQPGFSHSVRVSPSGEYLVDILSQAGRPIQLWLINRDGQRQQILDPNTPDRLSHVRIQAPETLQVEARDGHMLDAQIIRPFDFDPTRKYPVLISVYSGPQAPTVRQSWGGTTYLWHQMLAQQGYVIWMCDNRSATYGGASDAWPIHRNLGENELRDIEDGIAWLKQQPWIDGDRIGIWGWSYGGYMSAYALTHSKNFRLGIAGAPVTDWRNYDTIYTERYMGLPGENEAGYESSSVVAAAADLHGHLLLIHGSMDDNVHLTNTMQLVYELQKANKSFDLMIYPRNRHGVTDPRQNRHLRELMTRAVLEKL